MSQFNVLMMLKSLYSTMRVHLCEALLDTGRRHEEAHTTTNAADCVSEVWKLVKSAVDTDSHERLRPEEPRIPFRLFFLCWPLMAIAQSKLAPWEMRTEAMEMLAGDTEYQQPLARSGTMNALRGCLKFPRLILSTEPAGPLANDAA